MLNEKYNLKLKKANEKTDKVYTSSNKVREMLENLKPTIMNKNNSVISNENINEIKNLIDEVQDTAKSISSVNDLNIMIKEVEHIMSFYGIYNNKLIMFLTARITELEYSKWQNFEKIIEKAKISCENSGISAFEHFTDVSKTIKMPKGAEKEIKDYKLTRYACYIIAQNGDPRKEVIALAQTYFAVQTRKQEITEKEYSMLTEDEKRFYQRDLTRKGNYSLNQAAKNAGVKNFDKFHNAGYK